MSFLYVFFLTFEKFKRVIIIRKDFFFIYFLCTYVKVLCVQCNVDESKEVYLFELLYAYIYFILCKTKFDIDVVYYY